MEGQKPIIEWKSKVQYRKNTPYISLVKHLSNSYSLTKGNEITCKLILVNDKLKVVIDIE